MSVRCDQLADQLPEVASGSVQLEGAQRHHVERCLRCQAQLVQHRRVLRTLSSLRSQVLEPAPGMLTDLLAGLEAAGERTAVRSLLARHRVVYMAAATAAGAAGAAGALVIASRTRRTRLDPTG